MHTLNLILVIDRGPIVVQYIIALSIDIIFWGTYTSGNYGDDILKIHGWVTKEYQRSKVWERVSVQGKIMMHTPSSYWVHFGWQPVLSR